MIDTIKQAYQFILTLPPQFWAVLAGLLISWFGTQAVKFYLPDSWPDPKHKKAVRGAAVGFGFLPTYWLWPTHDAPAAIWSLLVGLSSPVLYLYAVRILYHYWPYLEPRLSARPITLKKDGDGNVVGFKEGDDKTQYFHGDLTTTKPDNTVPKDKE